MMKDKDKTKLLKNKLLQLKPTPLALKVIAKDKDTVKLKELVEDKDMVRDKDKDTVRDKVKDMDKQLSLPLE